MLQFLKDLLGVTLSEEQEKLISEELEKKYVSKDEFDNSQQTYNDDLKSTKLNYEMNSALDKYGAKNPKAVSSLIDKDKISFNETGEVTGLLEQLEALKKSDEYLFKTTEITGFKITEKSDTASKNPRQMNYSELCKYFGDSMNK